jgi:hypothetical protein
MGSFFDHHEVPTVGGDVVETAHDVIGSIKEAPGGSEANVGEVRTETDHRPPPLGKKISFPTLDQRGLPPPSLEI